MKEQYIKQVEKELSLTRKAKKEVVRDLNEVFASALEHGETEQQVIERLGTPKEFAENTAEQLGMTSPSRCCNRCLSLLLPFLTFLLFSCHISGNIGLVNVIHLCEPLCDILNHFFSFIL